MSNAHIIEARFNKTLVNDGLRNTGLDVVRGVCVLLVVIAHTNNMLKSYTSIYKILYPLGEMAQDLFFALSGYLIGQQIIRMVSKPDFNKKDIFKFYTKRWIRTIPFYFIFLLINFCLFYFVYRWYGPEFLKTDFNVVPYFTFTQNLIRSHPAFFPEIWPIPVEEWSYLLLPLPFVFFSSFFNKGQCLKRQLLYLVLIIIAVEVLRLAHIYTSNPETDRGIRKIVIFRMDALVYGFILVILLNSKLKAYIVSQNKKIFYMGVIMLFASLFFHKFLSQQFYNAVLFVYQPLFCTCLLPFFIYKAFKVNFFSAIFTHISLIGYAVLLCHLYCFQFLFMSVFQTSNLPAALIVTGIYLIVVFLFATFFYNKVERPVLLLRKNN